MDTNFLRQKISELTKKYSSKKVSIDEDLSLSDDFSLGEDDTVKYHPKPDDFATNRSGDNKNTPYSENKLLDLEILNSPKVITPRSTSLRSGKGKELIDTPRARSINSLQNSEHSKSLNSPQGSGIVVDEVDDYSDLFSDKELENPQEIKEDNYSDLLSDEELENPQEIDEDSDDSSDYEPFKNIHLVSDDFLEDIQTASEASLNNSENADERLTNRSTRSTPRSIRSIPLSPFISSPVIGKRSETKIKEVTSENESIIEEQLESDINVLENYKSSFEEEKDSSDSGSRILKKSSSSGSGTLKKSSESGSGALEKQKSSREDSSSSRSNSGKSEENFESSTSASIVKTPSESSVSLQQESPAKSSRSSGNLSGNDGEVLVTDGDNNSSKSDQHLNPSTIRKRGEEKRNVVEEEIEKGGRQSEQKRGILRKEKREEQKKEERGREEEKSLNNPIELIKPDDSYSEVITELEDFDENDQDNKNKPSDYFKESEESSKIVNEKIKRKSEKKSEEIPHTDRLKHSVNKPKKLNNKHVQCDLLRFQRSRVPIYYDFEPTYREESIFNRIQPRRRPIDIDTRVKSLPNRPVITTNIKLFDENQLGDLDFHIGWDNKFEDYNLNPTLAMDRILRNQIDLTKYFMESHHKMYMACCKIVKSMNEDYKNDGVCQDNG